MKETDYAYAVARVRANELSLLTTAEMEQLIMADGLPAALRILGDKGWGELEHYENVSGVLLQQSQKTWQLLSEITPELHELDFLIIKNDFHNIKALLKAFVQNEKGFDSLIFPTVSDPEQMKEAIYNKKFGDLPAFARDITAETYEVLVHTFNGQLADIMLDAAALNASMAKAAETGNPFVIDLAELMGVTANIKIALRAARTEKDGVFLGIALCNTKTLDKAALAAAAVKGEKELTAWLANTVYSAAADFIKQSSSSFEKWCDDFLMEHVQQAKYKSFSIEPLVAFYLAKDAELKSVRIILSCKHNHLSAESIKERVRKLYV